LIAAQLVELSLIHWLHAKSHRRLRISEDRFDRHVSGPVKPNAERNMDRERYDQAEPDPAPLRAAGQQRFMLDLVDVVEIGAPGLASHRSVKHRYRGIVVNRAP